MYRLLKKKTFNTYLKELKDDIKPVEIRWSGDGSPARIMFDNEIEVNGACIRCFNPPCIYYKDEELKLPIFNEFPVDKNDQVCPTLAISWPINYESPIIDSDLCILCGLCVQRCPVRAISFDNKSAIINDTQNTIFIESKKVANPEYDTTILNSFSNIKESGIFLNESEEHFNTLYHRFVEISKKQTSQFPNHLARNLLLGVGVGAAMRRLGDTNIRMDLLLGPPGIKIGAGEVELSNTIIDTPRNLLDDIAVLSTRYHIDKEQIVPLVVCLSLPNLRSEYWQFVSDVNKILDIKINTITIGALIILIYNNKKLSIENCDEYFIFQNATSLKSKLEVIVDREINISVGYPGLLDSQK